MQIFKVDKKHKSMDILVYLVALTNFLTKCFLRLKYPIFRDFCKLYNTVEALIKKQSYILKGWTKFFDIILSAVFLIFQVIDKTNRNKSLNTIIINIVAEQQIIFSFYLTNNQRVIIYHVSNGKESIHP